MQNRCGRIAIKNEIERANNLHSSMDLLLLMFYFDGQFPFNIPWLLYYPKDVMYCVPFRYHKRWIPREFQNEYSFFLQEALIVMKYKVLEQVGKEQKYIPIRKVSIIKSELSGEYYFLYLKLGAFVEYRPTKLDQFSKLFTTVIQQKDKNWLVWKCCLNERIPFVLSKDEKKESDAWFILAKLLNKQFRPRMSIYENTMFLKFQGLYNIRENKRLVAQILYGQRYIYFTRLIWFFLTIVKNVVSKIYETKLLCMGQKYRNEALNFVKLIEKKVASYEKILILKKMSISEFVGFKLQVNQTYTVKILQYISPAEEKTMIFKDTILKLNLSKEDFFMIKDTNTIIGHQDIHLFTMKCLKPVNTLMIIKNEEGKVPKYKYPEAITEYRLTVPEIVLPIAVVHSLFSILRSYVIPIIIFLLGSFLVTFSTSNTLVLPFLQFLNSPVGRLISLILGFTLQGLGLYVFKKER